MSAIYFSEIYEEMPIYPSKDNSLGTFTQGRAYPVLRGEFSGDWCVKDDFGIKVQLAPKTFWDGKVYGFVNK